MKIKLLLCLLILGITSCETSEETQVYELRNTRWKVVCFNEDSEVQNAPSNSESVELVFRGDSMISLSNCCNFHSAKYAVKENNFIEIKEPSAMTLMLCGDEENKWQDILLSHLPNAESYQIERNVLTIHAQGGKLVFRYVSELR